MNALIPPTADLERLPADADPVKVADLMARDGGLVLEGLLSQADVHHINADLQPFVDARPPGYRDHHLDEADFYGSNTIRIQGLARKSRTFVDSILLHPALLALADTVLLPYCGDYWMSQAETIFIGPGNPAQELHRDDLNWAFAAQLRFPLQISVLTALGEYSPEIGSTMVVPGSHLWPLDREIDPADARPVDLNPGDSLVYLGNLVHGGGHNRTDRWRRGLYVSYLVGWLTPEEAVPLGVGNDVAATLPRRARELLGFSNLRQPVDASGAGAALELWQLDADDLKRNAASFHHR